MKVLLYLLLLMAFIGCKQQTEDSEDQKREIQTQTSASDKPQLTSNSQEQIAVEGVTEALESLGRSDLTDEQLAQMGVSREVFEQFMQQALDSTNQQQGLSSVWGAVLNGSTGNLEDQVAAEKRAIALIREVSGVQQATFVEDHLRRKKGRSLEQLNLYKTLAEVDAVEALELMLAHYKVSQEEFGLMTLLPSLNRMLSKREIDSLYGASLPPAYKRHLTSGTASAGFQKFHDNYRVTLEKAYQDFKAQFARKQKTFHRLNPSWESQKNTAANVYKDSKNRYIYLPLGEASFADQLISFKQGQGGSNQQGILGSPNMPVAELLGADPRFCNLGVGGQAILHFKDNALINVNGPDLYIFEMGKIEPTRLEISKDGNTWIDLGVIQGGTAAVDIENFVDPSDYFTYLRLTDLETESEIPGADIDAVAAIGGAFKIELDSAVLFDSGSYALKPEANAVLQDMLSLLNDFNSGTLLIEGHTDNVGNAKDNLALSKARAEAVAQFIESQNGNQLFKMITKGFGASRPVASNADTQGRAKNRRVTLVYRPD